MVPGDRFARDLFATCLDSIDSARPVFSDSPISWADLYIVHEGVLKCRFPARSQVIAYGPERILRHPMSEQWCDVMLVPLRARECLFRVRRALVRFPKVIDYGGMHLQPGELMMNDRSIDLTPREYRVLSLLFHRYSQTVHRDILKSSLGFERDRPTRIVDVTVSNLRKLADKHNLPYAIDTVKNTGYRLRLIP